MRTIFTLIVSFILGLFTNSAYSQTYAISNCAFNYISPAGGTNLTFGDDELKGPIAIPFNFSFFWQQLQSIVYLFQWFCDL